MLFCLLLGHLVGILHNPTVPFQMYHFFGTLSHSLKLQFTLTISTYGGNYV